MPKVTVGILSSAEVASRAVLYSLIYLLLRGVVRLTRTGKTEQDKDLEILVLRHQLKVLRRRAGRPTLRQTDRALFAALASSHGDPHYPFARCPRGAEVLAPTGT